MRITSFELSVAINQRDMSSEVYGRIDTNHNGKLDDDEWKRIADRLPDATLDELGAIYDCSCKDEQAFAEREPQLKKERDIAVWIARGAYAAGALFLLLLPLIGWIGLIIGAALFVPGVLADAIVSTVYDNKISDVGPNRDRVYREHQAKLLQTFENATLKLPASDTSKTLISARAPWRSTQSA